MPKKEPKKYQQWERDRRNRLNNNFKILCKNLPSYDPCITLSKTEILQKASTYIEELKQTNQNILFKDKQDLNDKKENILNMLEERVSLLLKRNEQLVNILKKAGISIPKELDLNEKFSKPKLWSNKISQTLADTIVKNHTENGMKKSKSVVPLGNNVSKCANTTSTTTSTTVVTKSLTKTSLALKKTPKVKEKHQNSIIKTSKDNKIVKTPTKSKIQTTALNKVVSTCDSIILEIDGTKKSSTSAKVSNVEIKNNVKKVQKSTVSTNVQNKNTIVTNSTLLSTPIMATGFNDRQISTLGAGTLILTDGTIYPILPVTNQIFTQPTVLTTLVQQPTSSNPPPTLLLVNQEPKITPLLSSSNKSLINTTKFSKILPNSPGVKKNIIVKKIPIPSLKKTRNTKININKSKSITEIKTNKIKEIGVEEKLKEKTDLDEPVVKTRKLETTSEKLVENDNKENKVSKENSKNVEKKSTSCYTVDSLCNKEITDNEKLDSNTEKNLNESKSNKDLKLDNSLEVENTTNSITKVTETIPLNLPQNDFSNDLFASLQVPTGSHHPESISPTAAFLLTFPLVSNIPGGKISEVVDDNSESQQETPNLLQIGGIDQKNPDTNIISFDHIPFFDDKNRKESKSDCSKIIPLTAKEKSSNIAIESNCLFSDMPLFQNTISSNIFNYEHVPVTHKLNDIYPLNTTITNSKILDTTTTTTKTTFSGVLQSATDSISYCNTTDELQVTSNPYITKVSVSKTADTTSFSCSNLDSDLTKNYLKYPKDSNFSLPNQKPLVNWMTTPDNRQKSNNSQRNHKNVSSDKTYQNTNHISSWSSNKLPAIAETSHTNLVASTLPMLVGDLALNTTNSMPTYESKDLNKTKYSNDNQISSSSFFSVSQLVEHKNSMLKTDTNVRKPQNRMTKSNLVQKQIKKPNENQINSNKFPNLRTIPNSYSYLESYSDMSTNMTNDWMKFSLDTNKSTYKTCSSTYSAEALIANTQSNQKCSQVTTKRCTQYDPFYSANDYPIQDSYYYSQSSNNNFTHTTSSAMYQPSNFQSSFPTSSALTLDFDTDYSLPVNNQIKQNYVKRERKSTFISPQIKRTAQKRKQSGATLSETTTGLTGLTDFSFLSMTTSTNTTSICADDSFYSHTNFFPTNTYSVTSSANPSQNNMMYTKNFNQQNCDYSTSCNLLPPPLPPVTPFTRNSILPPQNTVASSPSGTGNSLTNFNLSTIFPEINKPVPPGLYDSSAYRSSNNNLPILSTQQSYNNYGNN